MADAPIASLEELLRALAKERSLRGRLRVLGHSWQLLRALSPREREQVALRLGSKWAWKRVERAFLKDGELSEHEQLVGDAFERMGDSDPGELRRMARMIRDGDRAGAQDLLMMTLTEALEEEAEEEEETLAEERIEAEPEVESESSPISELVDRAEEVLASALARPVEEPAPLPEPRPVPAPVPVRLPEPDPEPAAPPVAPTPAPASIDPELGPAPDPPIALAASGNGADRLRVLRALEKSQRPGADLGRAGRSALIESLGGGWASRRALSRMIRTRSLEGLDEVLELIRQLARPGQQAWCLGDLLAHWELDAGELDRILEAAPTDAARRRLAHR